MLTRVFFSNLTAAVGKKKALTVLEKTLLEDKKIQEERKFSAEFGDPTESAENKQDQH